MLEIKIHAGGQVQLPGALTKKYALQEGDTLSISELEDGFVVVPKKVLREKKLRQQMNERLWDLREEEAEEAFARGEVVGPFEDVEEALKSLKTARV